VLVLRRQGECPYLGVNGRDGLLAPVLLWDATMALSIARALQARVSRRWWCIIWF